jgi:hypothetical protein
VAGQGEGLCLILSKTACTALIGDAIGGVLKKAGDKFDQVDLIYAVMELAADFVASIESDDDRGEVCELVAHRFGTDLKAILSKDYKELCSGRERVH